MLFELLRHSESVINVNSEKCAVIFFVLSFTSTHWINCLFACAEVNRRDYRAWYGLGQTYEILKMPYYCLYYYKQAQMLR